MNRSARPYQFVPLTTQRCGALTFLTRLPLRPETLQQIADSIRLTRVERAAPLEGRGVSMIIPTTQCGGVFIKQYRRGGILRFVIPDLYLGLSPERVLHEFKMLERAQASGVAVPTPIAAISSGRGVYRGWLAIEEFPNSVTIASKSMVDESAVRDLSPQIIEQIHRLIHAKIFHTDLHPGNVLVNGAGEIRIIDFDKASYFAGSKNDLRDRYLTRWRRAVIKHRLPESLSESVCPGLRMYLDGEDSGLPASGGRG